MVWKPCIGDDRWMVMVHWLGRQPVGIKPKNGSFLKMLVLILGPALCRIQSGLRDPEQIQIGSDTFKRFGYRVESSQISLEYLLLSTTRYDSFLPVCLYVCH